MRDTDRLRGLRSPICNGTSVLFGLLSMAALICPAFAGPVSVPPRPEAKRPKPRIDWNGQPTFQVTYGKTVNICATVTPTSLQSKITWPSDNPAALQITPTTDPECTGVLLPVKARMDSPGVCVGNANVNPKLNGIPAGIARGTIIRPMSTKATVLAFGQCQSAAGGGLSLWELALQTADVGTPNFDGLPILEQLDLSGDACQLGAEINPDPSPIGPPVAASNAIRDRNNHCVPGSFPKSCTSVFKQRWKVGECITSPVDLTFAFDAAGNMTLTRQDGNKVVGPIAPGPGP